MASLFDDIRHTSTLVIGPGKEASFNKSIVLPDASELAGKVGVKRLPYGVPLPSAEIPFEPVELSLESTNPFLQGSGEISPILRRIRTAEDPGKIDLMEEHIRYLKMVDWQELERIQIERSKAKRVDQKKVNTAHLINILNAMGMKINTAGKPSKRVDVIATLLTYRPILEEWERRKTMATAAQQEALYRRIQAPRLVEAPEPTGFAAPAATGPTIIGYAPYAEGYVFQ